MALIKSTENTSDASDRNPTTCVSEAFYNACDVASSEASDCDPTATTLRRRLASARFIRAVDAFHRTVTLKSPIN